MAAAGFGIDVKTLRRLVEARTVSDAWESEYTSVGGLAGLVDKIQTSAKAGVTSASVESRKEHFGRNELPQKEPAGFLQLAWEALQDATLIMLVVSAIFSLALGMAFEHDKSTAWVEGAAILFAVIVVVVVTAGNDYVKDRQFLQLNATMEDESFHVIRDGEPSIVRVKELVVGDMLELEVGLGVPADGVLVQGNDIKCDEHAMTGESDLIIKNESAPVLLSGTKVMEGSGQMLVVAVGKNSQAGIIKDLILNGRSTAEEDADAAPQGIGGGGASSDGAAQPAAAPQHEGGEEELTGRSVLGAKLDILALQIGKGGGVVAVFCFFVMFIRFIIEKVACDTCEWEDTFWSEILSFVITAITILVVAVPEGLPLAVTLSLAFSGHRMLADKNLVKHLDACETMGCATTIASDKTGTLTTSRMTVKAAMVAGRPCEPSPDGEIKSNKAFVDLLSQSIALNSAKISRVKKNGAGGPDVYEGNPTECGLIVYLRDELGHDAEDIRKVAEFSFDEPIKAFPFSSDRKKMSFVQPLDSGNVRVHTKGAAERVLALCDSMVAAPDAAPAGASAVDSTADVGTFQVVSLDEDAKKSFQDKIDAFASRGLRTLALGFKDIAASDLPAGGVGELDAADAESGLTLLCVVGIQDPPRPEVKGAIQRCRDAGISVMMVTGDHLSTAKAIAKDVGILDDSGDYVAMEGKTFRERVLFDPEGDLINQEEFDKIWPSLRVLARSSPKDKFTLVRGLQNSSLFRLFREQPGKFKVPIYPDRQVIAVTGDGTNDAPALSKADVGFAMGIQGTNVAKTACDIVLMDDNFSSIVAACKWGRNVYDSVAKFLQFQLTVNISAIVLAGVGSAWLAHSPIKTVQMLWVNLIMDSFASLALATEPPVETLLDRPPYGRNRPMISKQMWANMLGHAFYQLVVIFAIWIDGENWGMFELNGVHGRDSGHNDPPTEHYTVIFNTFVLMQIFNELNSRKLYGEYNTLSGIQNNAWFIVIVVGTLAAQTLIVQAGGIALSVSPLNGTQWAWCLLFGVLSLPWQYVINFFARIILPYFPEKEYNEKAEEADAADATSTDHVRVSVGSAAERPAGIHFRARRSSSVEQLALHTTAGEQEMAKRAEAFGAQHETQVRRSVSGRED